MRAGPQAAALGVLPRPAFSAAADALTVCLECARSGLGEGRPVDQRWLKLDATISLTNLGQLIIFIFLANKKYL